MTFSGLLRASQQKLRVAQLEEKLQKEGIIEEIENFKMKNIKIERSSEDPYSNRCKVTGKSIKSDFYLYPSVGMFIATILRGRVVLGFRN